MYIGLQLKPFYFLTDRETYYQFLVDNRDRKFPKKHLYYPEEYEKMSPNSIEKYKNKSVYKLLWWALTNQDKLEYNDKKIVNSTLMNSLIVAVVCMFGAKSLRKLLFRTQMPVLEIKLERLGFNIRLLKAFLSYSLFAWVGYKFISSELRQTHLVDLAFEYKYHFSDKMHSKTDSLYEELWVERIKAGTKADEVV